MEQDKISEQLINKVVELYGWVHSDKIPSLDTLPMSTDILEDLAKYHGIGMKKTQPALKIGQKMAPVPPSLFLPSGQPAPDLQSWLASQSNNLERKQVLRSDSNVWILTLHFCGVGGVNWLLELRLFCPLSSIFKDNIGWAVIYNDVLLANEALIEVEEQLDSMDTCPLPPIEGIINTANIQFTTNPLTVLNYQTSTIYICPLCNSPMRKRDGKFGVFYGCSAYPECQGILNEWGKPNKKTKALLLAKQKMKTVGQKIEKAKLKHSLNNDIEDRLEGLMDE